VWDACEMETGNEKNVLRVSNGIAIYRLLIELSPAPAKLSPTQTNTHTHTNSSSTHPLGVHALHTFVGHGNTLHTFRCRYSRFSGTLTCTRNHSSCNKNTLNGSSKN